jgi:hypothetical protein
MGRNYAAIAGLEQFSVQVTAKLERLDWLGKRDIIRILSAAH